jgi:HAD superfamily hydrolase (TIGR01549 family)
LENLSALCELRGKKPFHGESIYMIQGILFDFGYVIGYPPEGIDRKYLYLDWDGIDGILQDPRLAGHLRQGVGRVELEALMAREIYRVFVEHEQTDSVDPQSNRLLLQTLHQVFDCPIDQALVDRLLLHLDTMKYITIDPAAVKVMAELRRRNYRLGLVSNMMLPGKLLRAKLQEAGIQAYFDPIVISSDVGFIKPHPGIFLAALSQCQLEPGEAVFVGDTYQQDVLGAKGVGMKTAWLNSRREPRAVAAGDPPDEEIESLEELLDISILRGCP